MKNLILLLLIISCKVSFGSQSKNPKIDTEKYSVVKTIYKENNICTISIYEKKYKSSYSETYDRIGRIISDWKGNTYAYETINDTLIRYKQYQSKNKIFDTIQIEKFIYNTNGSVKSYLSSTKNLAPKYSLNSQTDSFYVVYELDELNYDSNQRIVKIDHYEITTSNFNILNGMPSISKENMFFNEIDSFIYDIKGRLQIKRRYNSMNEKRINEEIEYDIENRIINITTIMFGYILELPNKSIDSKNVKKYFYSKNKNICYEEVSLSNGEHEYHNKHETFKNNVGLDIYKTSQLYDNEIYKINFKYTFYK